MTKSFMDGFEQYGGKPGEGWAATDRPLTFAASGKALFATEGPTRFHGRGMDVTIDRLPNGKWLLLVNGVEMHFDQQPRFTIPA